MDADQPIVNDTHVHTEDAETAQNGDSGAVVTCESDKVSDKVPKGAREAEDLDLEGKAWELRIKGVSVPKIAELLKKPYMRIWRLLRRRSDAKNQICEGYNDYWLTLQTQSYESLIVMLYQDLQASFTVKERRDQIMAIAAIRTKISRLHGLEKSTSINVSQSVTNLTRVDVNADPLAPLHEYFKGLQDPLLTQLMDAVAAENARKSEQAKALTVEVVAPVLETSRVAAEACQILDTNVQTDADGAADNPPDE